MLAAASADPEVRAVVVSARGKHFSAGLDLMEASSQPSGTGAPPPPPPRNLLADAVRVRSSHSGAQGREAGAWGWSRGGECRFGGECREGRKG